jgi:hypothetical protein
VVDDSNHNCWVLGQCVKAYTSSEKDYDKNRFWNRHRKYRAEREGKRDRGSAAYIETVGQGSSKLNPGVVAMPEISSANRRGANDEKEKKMAGAVARRGGRVLA